MRKWVAAGLVLLAIGVGFWWQNKENLLSPLGGGVIRFGGGDYRVVGFLPSWMVGKTIDYCEQINEMVFLGVGVDENGGLIWDSQAKKMESEEFVDLKEKFEKCGGKSVLGIKMFEDNKIEKLINNPEARRRLIDELKEVVKTKGFDGVNMDLEFQGDPLAVLGEDFVGLIGEIKRAGVGEVGVDVFANTVIKGSAEGVGSLMREADYVLVMAYDFSGPGSARAGPVAPMISSRGRDIWEVVGAIVSKGLDKDKIVMAYPLYGYEWKTGSEEFGAEVVEGWWALASYKRMRQMEKKEEGWDEEAMSPWLVYSQDGETKQIYYENLESLRRKFSLVREVGLGGVGFWALGYEGEYGEVWEELKKKGLY